MAEREHLWDSICFELKDFCVSNLHRLNAPEDMLRVKEMLLLLAETMSDEAFALSPKILLDGIACLWDRMVAIELQAMTKLCSTLIKPATLKPLIAPTLGPMHTEVEIFRLDSIRLDDANPFLKKALSIAQNIDELERSVALEFGIGSEVKKDPRRRTESNQEPFVKYFFSAAIPVLIRELHKMIVRLFAFASFNVRLGDKGESVCLAFRTALLTVAQKYESIMKAEINVIPLEVTCQAYLDTSVLARSVGGAVEGGLSKILVDALSSWQWADSISLHLEAALRAGYGALEKVAHTAQDIIFEDLSVNIEDLLLSLKRVRWDATDSLPRGPHSQVEGIVEFLRRSLAHLSAFPQPVREAAHFTCCSRVCKGILELLLSASPTVQKISMLNVVGLDYDVKCLESYADSCAVPQLQMCFVELRDLVKALLSPDISSLADERKRTTSFPYLDPFKMACILDKVCLSYKLYAISQCAALISLDCLSAFFVW